MPNLSTEHYPPKEKMLRGVIEDAQGSDLAPIFGDLSQSEICFEIKSPLATFSRSSASSVFGDQ